MASAKMTELPVGFGFDPTNEEIIFGYLYNKIIGKPLPSNAVVECDLYGDEGDEEQWRKIFEQSGEKPLYFFTKIKKIENESQVKRQIGCGTWKLEEDKKIYCDEKETTQIGSLRKFTYVPKKESKVKGRLVMREYRLDGCLLNKIKHNDYVLCQFRKKEE